MSEASANGSVKLTMNGSRYATVNVNGESGLFSVIRILRGSVCGGTSSVSVHSSAWGCYIRNGGVD
jgi:hypothetical protein